MNIKQDLKFDYVRQKAGVKRLTKEEYVHHCWHLVEQFLNNSHKFGKYIGRQVALFKSWTTDPRYEYRVEAVDKVFKYFSYLNINLGDKYVQFPMLPWQAFLVALLFGFYRVDNNSRKHTELFLFIARKNGKTAFASALIIYGFLSDGITDPQSILLAMNQKQASNSLRYCKNMIFHSPALIKRLHPQRYKILSRDKRNSGFIEIMSSIEPERLEGFSPSMTILDELHGFASDKAEDVYNSIKSGTGARTSPITFICSTAGTKDNAFFTNFVKGYKDVLDGELEDESICGLLFQPDEGDDLTDPLTWTKSNPSLGVVTSLDSLKEGYNRAVNSASPRTWYNFLTRRVNIFTEQPNNWLHPERLDKCFKPLKIEDFKGKDCFLGVDLSTTTDLASLAVVFGDPETLTLYVFMYFFLAGGSKLKRAGNFDLTPYIPSYVHLSEGKIVDYRALMAKIDELNTHHNVIKLLYDRYNAPYVISEIQSSTEVYCEDFAQSASKFNSPLKYIQEAVEEEKITFATNPVFHWQFGNVVIREMDSNGNIKIDKRLRKESVDGIVSAAMGIGGFLETHLPIYGRSGG
jgi:phage terminase large subunit-like protein